MRSAATRCGLVRAMLQRQHDSEVAVALVEPGAIRESIGQVAVRFRIFGQKLSRHL
jgi:hypothetical protein